MGILRHVSLSLKILLMIPTLMALGFIHASAAGNPAVSSNLSLLTRLDSLVANHDKIIARKEAGIRRLRNEYANAQTTNRKLDAANALYNEYYVYNPDSALYYAKASTDLAMAKLPNDYDRIASSLLDQAFIFATQGFSNEAARHMESIDVERLSNEMKIKFYQTGQFTYSNLSLFNNDNKDMTDPSIVKANAYRDSLMNIDPDHLPEVLWAPIAVQIDSQKEYKPSAKDVAALEKAVESAVAPSRTNAINAYWLARHYGMKGDDEKYVRYMTMAAIYDTEIENREIAAITELADWLFNHGDTDRAYTYIIYSSDQATAYHNRPRVVNIGTVLPSVRDAYRQDIIDRDRRLRQYLWMLIALTIFLAASATLIVVENRRIRRARREMAELNSRLEASVEQRDQAIAALERANTALSETNNVLSESNTAKQGLVALAFRLTSDYINALDDFRKKLLRRFKAKEYVELGVMLNDQELLRDHYKDFYVAFDHTVLSIFPDFVEEYNASAQEDARADSEAVMKNRTLNTRMRIYALRRLGVEKSADIAKMLNVSIRTVYNNRG